MFSVHALTPDAKLYFENLPIHMQEMFSQTGLSITTKEELQDIVENMGRS